MSWEDAFERGRREAQAADVAAQTAAATAERRAAAAHDAATAHLEDVAEIMLTVQRELERLGWQDARRPFDGRRLMKILSPRPRQVEVSVSELQYVSGSGFGEKSFSSASLIWTKTRMPQFHMGYVEQPEVVGGVAFWLKDQDVRSLVRGSSVASAIGEWAYRNHVDLRLGPS